MLYRSWCGGSSLVSIHANLYCLQSVLRRLAGCSVACRSMMSHTLTAAAADAAVAADWSFV
jgi:hypothetical protein